MFGLPWQPVMSTSFLVVILIVIWGATQGWFSKRIRKPPTPKKRDIDDCEVYKKEIRRLQARISELEDDNTRLRALAADLEKQIQQLLETINKLTMDLDACRNENARLRAALKQALDDLAACRAALAKCRAELLAKKVSDAVCKLAPENANLLR